MREEREGVQEEEGFDAGFVLEEHGRDLVHRFPLLEAPFERRLPLMGFEHLRRRQVHVVGEQRVHAVALAVVGDLRAVDLPRDQPSTLRDAAVAGVGAGSTAVLLAIHVLRLLLDLHLEVGRDPASGERREAPTALAGPRHPPVRAGRCKDESPDRASGRDSGFGWMT